VGVFLSLLTGLLFGAGDFIGGLAGKRMSILQVLVGAHLIGLVGITAASLVLADSFIAADLGWGAVGGAFGIVGLGLLYRGLARGPMGVVAPLTAITSAAVPALWGVAVSGDKLSGAAWSGVILALGAIGLVGWSPTEGRSISIVGLGEALLAGVGFGAMFILLDQTDPASAPWPIAGARLLTGGLLLVLFVARGRRVFPVESASLRLVVGLGIFDTASNALFLYAADAGSLTIAGVLSSLYPVSTVLLARFLLGERLQRIQQAGFVAAVVAAALIATG